MPGGVAARSAGWKRWRTGYAPGPMLPAGETPGSIKVELFIAEQWVDVTRLDRDTPGVYYRDNITITRGKADEASDLDRGTCRFTLNNRDGRFAPRNPMSPYYGKLGRNTPCRVSVVQATGERRYRFHGEVSSWPQKWDITGTDVYVEVEASGVLRRLGQGGQLSSAMYRVCARATRLVAYWPCEDEDSSVSLGSAVAAAKAMTISGTPTLASSTDFHASADLPVMGSASFTGYVPTYDSSLKQAQVRFLLSVPAAGAADNQIICTVYTTGATPRWELYYNTGFGGTLGLRGFNTVGANVADTGTQDFDVDGHPMRVSLEFVLTGTTLAATIETLVPGAGAALASGTSATGTTLGRITRVVLAPNKGLTDTAMGHVLVQSAATDDLAALSDQTNAGFGEHAGPRIARLCAEDGVNYARVGRVGSSAAMGYQAAGSILDLIRQAVAVDMGRLIEPRDQVGLAYRDRETLYDQTAVLALDYAAHELADALDPTDDDQYTLNDVTAKRDNEGSSSRATRDTGPLSVDSIGRVETSVELNAYADSQLPDLAGWLLHLGTIDEARYPSVSLNLAHPTFTADDAMMTAALVLDIGDKVTIDNPPAWLPPDQIGLIVEGYTETLNGLEHTLVLNCSPESAHHIAVYDDTSWRYESDGSTLTSDVSEAATSLSVTIPSGPVWSHTDGDFDITIGGERMTVTGIAGATSPQTFTVTRSVNGIVKAHYSGDDVSLFKPAFYAI
jgi:hypothetical protein